MVLLGVEGYVRSTQTEAALNDVYVRRLVPGIYLRDLKDAYAQTIIDAGNKYAYGTFSGPEALASVADANRQAEDSWAKYLNAVSEDERRQADAIKDRKQQ